MERARTELQSHDTKPLLESHIRIVLWASSISVAAYAAGAWWTGNRDLYLSALAGVATTLAAVFARRQFNAGHISTAALTLGYVIEIAVCLVALSNPDFVYVLAFILVILLVLVLPHVRGRALQVFSWTTLLVNTTTMSSRLIDEYRSTSTVQIKTLINVTTGIILFGVAQLLLFQFSERIKQSLARVLATKDALSKSERLQREERVKLATTLDHIAHGVVKLNSSLCIAYLNPAAQHLLGVGEEAIGEEIDRIFRMKSPDADVTIASIERIARHQYATLPLPERAELISKDGTSYFIDGSFTPLEPSGAVLNFRDVGERMRLDALRTEKEAAEAATAARTQFLANMSHEIRTPMNAVIGMTGLLLDTPLDVTQREFVDTIRSSGSHLLAIINDILDFSRLDRGAVEFEHYAFDVRTCVEESLELVAPLAVEKNIELCLVADPQTSYCVMGDAGRLRQVLVNFLNNAVKFTDKGEVVIRVEQQPISDDRVRLLFSVQDTGIGISADQMDRLFKPFGQADASTTRKFGGTGLGLVISKQIVERMGGEVSVESESGKGSKFSFSMVATVVAGRDPNQRDTPVLRGKRILVVDDNATSRQILRTETERWGMVVDEASSGPAALEILRNKTFDAALLDYHMPEMDGMTLAKAIHTASAARNMPMVLLSSLGMTFEPGQQELFAVRLTKPVRIAQLLEQFTILFRETRATSIAPQKPQKPQKTTFKIQTLRILLAEDNPVNQRVATLMLQKLGYRADVVANGLEAVNAVERQPYDVVLMDVQMPEMDGLEATRTILRKIPREKRPRIIAMTAHAMAGDRERCLAAGMDDYINKPIEMTALGAALARTDRLPAVSSDKNTSPKIVRFNRQRVESLREMGELVGEDVVGDLVRVFGTESEKNFAAMKTALEAGDLQTLERLAHSYKSTCATLGGEYAAQFCQILESQAFDGEPTNAAAIIDTLKREAKILHTALEEYLRSLSSDKPG